VENLRYEPHSPSGLEAAEAGTVAAALEANQLLFMPSGTHLKNNRSLFAISWILPLVLVVLPALVQAQFNYTNNNGAITITGYTGSGGAVAIPSTIEVGGIDLPVRSIGNGAFKECFGLTSVVMPDSVTSIEDWAFYICFGLTNVTIGNSVTRIGEYAFVHCGLTSVTIPDSVTSIGFSAFGSCASLSSLTIGSSVTNLGSDAFNGCDSLINVTIPKSVARIEPFAFEHCARLTGVYFQGDAPSGGVQAFYLNDNVTVYYLPGTTNWTSTYGGRPTVLWNPQVQTADASFGVQTNQFGFTIAGSSNLVIVVEASTSLADALWSPVGTNKLVGGSSCFRDPNWTNSPTRIYRLRSP
jgi:hypothetical protein